MSTTPANGRQILILNFPERCGDIYLDFMDELEMYGINVNLCELVLMGFHALEEVGRNSHEVVNVANKLYMSFQDQIDPTADPELVNSLVQSVVEVVYADLIDQYYTLGLEHTRVGVLSVDDCGIVVEV